MKRALIVIVIVVVAGLAIYFFRISAIEREKKHREDLANNANSEMGVPVIVAPVIAGDVEKVLRYTGIVEAEEEINVYPKISGRMISVKVDENDIVVHILSQGIGKIDCG